MLESMLPALAKVAARLGKVERKLNRGTILARYDMGSKLIEVVCDEDKYGTESLPKLAVYLHRKTLELDDLRCLARTYTREQIEQLIDRKTAKGNYITLNHLLVLMRIARGSERREWLDRVFTEDLTVSQLAKEIDGKFSRKRSSTSVHAPSFS